MLHEECFYYFSYRGRFKPSQHVGGMLANMLRSFIHHVQHLPTFLYSNSWAYFYLYMVLCRDKANAGSLLNLINGIKEMLANVGQHFWSSSKMLCKLANMFQHVPTSTNIRQQGEQTFPTCCANNVGAMLANMLRWFKPRPVLRMRLIYRILVQSANLVQFVFTAIAIANKRSW